VWKFQDFSVTHILHEMNFRESIEVLKLLLLQLYMDSEFCQFSKFQLSKVKKKS